jgi:hypothetical protein
VVFVAACGDDTETDAADDATSETDDASGDDTATDDDSADDPAADDDSAADDGEAADDDGAVDDDAAAGDSEEGEEAAAPIDPPDEGQPVDLGEWYIELGDVAAGATTFTVSNSGENPHALAVARGTSYEELPLLDNGGVDTGALGDDFLGASDRIDSGQEAAVDFELEPGDYVFFCPIAVGPNSHAAQGQVLSVTVS